MSSAEDVLELSNSYGQQFMLGDAGQVRKQSVLEDAEEPKHNTTKRMWGCFKFTEVLGHTEAGIKVFEDIDWNEQRAATTGQGIVRKTAMRRRGS